MPTIGWFEILIVVAISIVVIGPKDFPHMLKKIGSWIGTTKKYINDIQSEVSNIDLEEDTKESNKSLKAAIKFIKAFKLPDPKYGGTGAERALLIEKCAEHGSDYYKNN